MSTSPTIADAAASSRRSSRCSTTGATRSSISSISARSLAPLPEGLKTEGNKVRGCQSQVWLVAEPEADGRIHVRADSDAILVKGLVSLLVRLYDRRTAQEILANPPTVLERGAGPATDARPLQWPLLDGGPHPGHGRSVRCRQAGLRLMRSAGAGETAFLQIEARSPRWSPARSARSRRR